MSNSKYEITDIAHKTIPSSTAFVLCRTLAIGQRLETWAASWKVKAIWLLTRMTLPGYSMTRSPAAAPMWTRTQF